MIFTTILLSDKAIKELIMPKMKIITKPKNSNCTCKCGRILTGGQQVGSCGNDKLGRPNVICLECRGK